jgi:hypothetical protein
MSSSILHSEPYNLNVTQNRAVIPNPDEAQSPHEVAEGPVEFITTKIQSEQPFSRKERMVPFITDNNCVPEDTQAKDVYLYKKRNLQDMQGVTKKTGTVIVMTW